MAPRERAPSIDHNEAYEAFMSELEKYHEKRGTHLEREPKVGPRHIDLQKLYERVVEMGGYDVVSDTKLTKLGWRKIAAEFLPASVNVIAMAFLVKTVYYKNLAAYEISTHHKREPPPKEILEDVTAKGGDLLTRTVENYMGSSARQADEDQDDKDAEGSPEQQKTPSGDKMDIDESGSTGRITRGLRNAPPQRVLYNQDPSIADAPRQSRHATRPGNSPTPGDQKPSANGYHDTSNASQAISNYEPQPKVPANLKPVTTPANNPEWFKQHRKDVLRRSYLSKGAHYLTNGIPPPGWGFIGPNIYLRALRSLQSGIQSEVQFALHHLVKMSYERGDKYRFDGFPGLAEALMSKILEITELVYGFKWEVSYSGSEEELDENVLNGLDGTPDLLKKIHFHPPLSTIDGARSAEFQTAINTISEASLIFRNMIVTLDINANYIAETHSVLVRQLIVILLNLPQRDFTTELRHHALDIAEYLTRYYTLDAEDPLYLSLLQELHSSDRGAIITALRALSLTATMKEAVNRLQNIPVEIIQRVCDWLMIDDEDLRNACLDFLNFFTAVTDNVDILVTSTNVEGLVAQLVRLLMYGAVQLEDRTSRPHTAVPPPDKPPKLSPNIIEPLIQITNEKEQSSAWLITCYELDPNSDTTQIALWQAYNEVFQARLTALGRSIMSAKDFITNVSKTFDEVPSAQIIQGPTPKYTIKGLKPRAIPVDQTRRPMVRCQWKVHENALGDNGECGWWYQRPQELWEHIVQRHLNIEKDGEGGWKLNSEESRSYDCEWASCHHFYKQHALTDKYTVAQHVKTHLPESSVKRALHREHSKFTPSEDEVQPRVWLNTPLDEKREATGIAVSSAIVLRNLARQMAKIEGTKDVEAEGGWVKRVFLPFKEEIFWVMGNNLSLKEYLTALVRVLAGAGVLS